MKKGFVIPQINEYLLAIFILPWGILSPIHSVYPQFHTLQDQLSYGHIDTTTPNKASLIISSNSAQIVYCAADVGV